MPGELLPTVITSLRSRVEEGFPFKSDQTGLLVSFNFHMLNLVEGKGDHGLSLISDL